MVEHEEVCVDANANQPKIHHTDTDSLFRYAEFLGFGEVHIKFDPKTGLRAIVAIHSLKRGPAIGGCRLIPYLTSDDALEDALRLAYMMSFKAAACGLPHGGGKAVLMKPKVIKNRQAYLETLGEFVNELGGRYITAVDSGTSPEDMDIIATKTSYVTCTSQVNQGDPSPHTAMGICRGIEAAVKFKLGKNSLSGIHIAIQGLGHVGYALAKLCHERGATLTVCDVNISAVQRCEKELGAQSVSVDAIYDVNADVFAPCALGAILNLQPIKRLTVSIIAGSANNQLAHHHHGLLLHKQGILYVPDFVLNAGGLIYVATLYDYQDPVRAAKAVENVYQILIEIFDRSAKENCSTNEIAEKIALERLK